VAEVSSAAKLVRGFDVADSRADLESSGSSQVQHERYPPQHLHQEGALHMLSDVDAIANLAVKDLKVARQFYEDALGLEPVEFEGDEVVVYKSGESTLNVYRSDYAGTNQATAVTWAVGDEVEQIVRTLKGRGVKFEHYDLPGMTRKGDIHFGGDMQVAWFKDPDGNILNIVNE